jgi:hypothetical protein
VGNFQLAVSFVSESHDKAQFNCSFCPCLQGVSKAALLIKAYDFSVFNVHIEENRIEWNTRRAGTVVTHAL